jgi:NADPH-dependent 2,4-dienoyl-CoA reductase/sulfur reductase-like enzyme
MEKENIQTGKNILIAGAGLTGCETALKFSQAGKRVTIIDMLPREKLGLGASPINAYALFNILEECHVKLMPETKLIDVTDDDVVVEKGAKEERLAFDTIILALGMKANANDDVIGRLKAAVPENYIVGDSNGKRGGLWNAITSAFDAAMAI